MQMKFFWMETGYTSQCYWAQDVDLSVLPNGVFKNGMRGFQGIVPMRITKGGRPCDFLGNSAALHVASERVITLIRDYGLTGYETYDVVVSGDKVELPKYYGLVAVGRGGHILPKESGVKYDSERRADGTRQIMGIQRLVLDESQWDGSDFLYVDEFPGGIIVTERVRDLFKKEKVKNCELTDLEEFHFG